MEPVKNSSVPSDVSAPVRTDLTIKVSPSGVSGSMSLASTLPLALGIPGAGEPSLIIPASVTAPNSSAATGASLMMSATKKVPLANWTLSTPVMLSAPSRPDWLSESVVMSEARPVPLME